MKTPAQGETHTEANGAGETGPPTPTRPPVSQVVRGSGAWTRECTGRGQEQEGRGPHPQPSDSTRTPNQLRSGFPRRPDFGERTRQGH